MTKPVSKLLPGDVEVNAETKGVMQDIAGALDFFFNPPGTVQENIFVLFVMSAQGREDGKMNANYVTNGSRDQVMTALNEWIMRNSVEKQ